MAILEVKNLTFKYKSSDTYALSNINLSVNDGEFVVLCGESGCGKSTLLKLFKKQLAPSGDISGEILYCGVEVAQLNERVSVTDIGFVVQNPDDQIVTDKVWHELAFGLESLGEKASVIRRRVAEVCGFFGIVGWYNKKTCELSGGQKQLLNLASIMVMQPKILVLDEPTSQLDPIAAAEFIATLQKINKELAITIILVEHRLEEVFPIADKIILMNKAEILCIDTPKKVGAKLKKIRHKMELGLPSSVRIFNELDIDCECPLSICEGKQFLSDNFNSKLNDILSKNEVDTNLEVAIEIADGYFRYEKDLPDVLNGLDIKIYKGELLCIMGGNGTGKTTMLKVLSGVKRLYRGKLRIWGKKIKEYNGVSLYRNNLASLPQSPQTLFLTSKVVDDLLEVTNIMGLSKDDATLQIKKIVDELEINELLEKHPYDLSGGEQQKCALAKILLMNPKIILLDEPTKGIDAYSKTVLAKILTNLTKQGKTIVVVTHDIEFAAAYANRCAMFFDGQIVSIEPPIDFFSNNSYYTTAASRISRGLFNGAVTCKLVVEQCKINGVKNV